MLIFVRLSDSARNSLSVGVWMSEAICQVFRRLRRYHSKAPFREANVLYVPGGCEDVTHAPPRASAKVRDRGRCRQSQTKGGQYMAGKLPLGTQSAVLSRLDANFGKD